jgi:hypothetical protein
MKIRALLEQNDKTAVGFTVPEDVVLALGKGKRPPVNVTLNGYTYRSSVAPMGDRYMVGVSAENRAAAGVRGGETHDIELTLDTEPRVVQLPDDFAAALAADPAAQRTFDALSNSNKGWHVSSIQGAKSDETRQRRIEKSVASLREGKPR